MIYSGVSIRLLSTVALLLPLSLSEQPTFEAASIKLHNPQSGFTKGRILPGGGIEARGMTAEDLLTYAYGILPNMISGLPKWAKETSFDLVAESPPRHATRDPSADAPGPSRRAIQDPLAQ